MLSELILKDGRWCRMRLMWMMDWMSTSLLHSVYVASRCRYWLMLIDGTRSVWNMVMSDTSAGSVSVSLSGNSCSRMHERTEMTASRLCATSCAWRDCLSMCFCCSLLTGSSEAK